NRLTSRLRTIGALDGSAVNGSAGSGLSLVWRKYVSCLIALLGSRILPVGTGIAEIALRALPVAPALTTAPVALGRYVVAVVIVVRLAIAVTVVAAAEVCVPAAGVRTTTRRGRTTSTRFGDIGLGRLATSIECGRQALADILHIEIGNRDVATTD